MSEELQDEIISINSIYGDDTLSRLEDHNHVYILKLPSQSSITLRLQFEADYPNSPPSILGTQHIGDDIAKGEGNAAVNLVRTVLAEVYSPGAPCIFNLIEEVDQRLEQHTQQQSSSVANQSNDQVAQLSQDTNDIYVYRPPEELGSPPSWILSDVVTEKKSIFIARCAAVSSPEEATPIPPTSSPQTRKSPKQRTTSPPGGYGVTMVYSFKTVTTMVKMLPDQDCCISLS